MIEEQPIDVCPARAVAINHAPAKELPLQQWEGEGGAAPTDAAGAEGSTVATTTLAAGTAPLADQPRRDAVDADAITERHFFAES
ncbi:MAG TPA: hypothetical protein VN805_11535 [Caulobacteraceae bacterium]|nr:hypothetical protein [Caulobacteraceae bacterium]